MEDLKDFAIYAWDNSRQSLDDAKVLCENGSYGHAIFLVELACEELTKALMWLYYPHLAEKEQEMIHESVETSHPKKMKKLKEYIILPHLYIVQTLTQFFNLVEACFLPEKTEKLEGFEELKENFKAESEKIGKKLEKLLKMREKALYVDYTKKSKPTDFSKGDCDEWIDFGNKLISYAFFVFRLAPSFSCITNQNRDFLLSPSN